MIDGYEELDDEGGVCSVLVHDDVRAFLSSVNKAERRHAKKAFAILKKIKDFGRTRINNTEQFKNEGRFSNGKGSSQTVWAVKAYQIRVYGGFKKVRGREALLCVEATKKKRDKADKAQLERVAVKLGEIDG